VTQGERTPKGKYGRYAAMAAATCDTDSGLVDPRVTDPKRSSQANGPVHGAEGRSGPRAMEIGPGKGFSFYLFMIFIPSSLFKFQISFGFNFSSKFEFNLICIDKTPSMSAKFLYFFYLLHYSL
jgi:hypothetical protein